MPHSHRLALAALRKYSLRDRKLPQIVTNHLRLNLNLIKLLSTVDTNNTTNHLGHHNHISQMRLNQIRLLIRTSFLLGLAEFLDEAHGLALQTAVEAAAGARVDYVAELVG